MHCSPVISYVECVQALCEALHVVGADLLQEVDVILRVEATHVVLRGLVWFEHLNNHHHRIRRSETILTVKLCINGIQRSPSSFCRAHSAAPDCESGTSGEASWDDQHLAYIQVALAA